jgi:hypothetical protein
MKRRCENPKDNQYHNYGAKGIAVSNEWQTFKNFINDMYEDYISFESINGKDTATIDRIDSTKNYCKDNCRWASQEEQARNRSNNISVIVDRIEYCTLTELTETYNVDYRLVYDRYRAGKRGLDLVKEKKRTTNGINHRGIKVEVNGITYESLSALQKDYSYISLVSISKRYKKGFTWGVFNLKA